MKSVVELSQAESRRREENERKSSMDRGMPTPASISSGGTVLVLIAARAAQACVRPVLKNNKSIVPLMIRTTPRLSKCHSVVNQRIWTSPKTVC